MQEVVLFYKGLDVPTRQILDSLPKMNVADAKKAIQEMAAHPQKWHNRTSTRCRSSDTSDGLATIQAQLNNLGREIKKVNEKVYAVQVGCELCNGPHYSKDCTLKKEGKTLEEAYYTQFGVPFPQRGRYKAAALGFYQRENGNTSYQERRQTMEESLSKFMVESTKRHDENSNLIKEIRASTDATIRNQGASIKALDIQIGQINKVLQERGSVNLPSSIEINLRDHVKSILTCEEAETPSIRRISRLREYSYDVEEIKATINSSSVTTLDCDLPPTEKDLKSFTLPCYTNNMSFNKALADLGASVSIMPHSTFTDLGLGELAPTKVIVELADRIVKRPKGITENVLVGIDKFVFPVDFIVLDKAEDIKVLLILERSFVSTSHAQIDVFERKIALGVGDDKITFKSDNPTSNIIKKVYVLGVREGMQLDLEARLMGEALILNRSQDPDFRDFIKLNDLNEPLELRRHRV
ncbi:hypothetical protein Tco_0781807 [Tanacetum coccineum]